MSWKKSIIYQIARYMIKNRHSGNYARTLRRLAFAFIIIVLILGIGAVALVGYTINKISSPVKVQNWDLVALEQLIRQKVIVLTEEQKAALIPIIKELNNPALAPQAKENLTRQMDQVLGPAQVQKLQEWQKQTQAQTKGFISSGKSAVSGLLSRYGDVPNQVLRNGLTGWRDLLGRTHTGTDGLLKALSASP